MAYLSILRTQEDRCEQCDSTEHVLRFVVSQSDEDDVRLVACIVCVIVAMDNAMEWNMSRQFAQALANRAAGEQVQALAREQKENLDERLRQARERQTSALPTASATGPSSVVRSDSGPESKGSARPAPNSRRSDRPSRSKGQVPHRST